MRCLFYISLSVLFCVNVTAQNIQSIADSNNLFAFNLYSQLSKEKSGNLFLSPFSISTALAMTYAGARNKTEMQMRNVLHFSLTQDSFHRQYKNYLSEIASDTGKNVLMEIANSIWIENNFKILEHFSEIAGDDYNSESKNVDFVGHTEEARKEINAWVEHKTHDKIKDQIKPLVISIDTRMVLVNAIYFNGKWNVPFSNDSTRNDTFYQASSVKTMNRFMNKTGHYKYYEDSTLQAIEIPYSGEKTSMLVILPKDTYQLKTMEEKLDNVYYNKITSRLFEQKVKLEIPKFKTTAEFRLDSALKLMGMPIAFDVGGDADFSGMSDERLYITAVVHKAFIDVSEEGTEAAGATAVVLGKAMLVRPAKTPSFIANHPFIFIIKDNATGSILFMGRITDPTKQ